MEYYSTVATVLPLVYVALVLESRLGASVVDHARPMHPIEVVSRAFAKVTALAGLPAMEAGLLIGLARQRHVDWVDGNLPPILFIATLLLVCPPIWREFEGVVPLRYREHVRLNLEALVTTFVLATVGFGWFGWFELALP